MGSAKLPNESSRFAIVGYAARFPGAQNADEFWDVLRGKMSLVGPRPERPELLRDLSYAIPLFEERMRDVKPGITGLAQISLGYTGAIPEGSEIAKLASTLQNPWQLDETKGSLADDMGRRRVTGAYLSIKELLYARQALLPVDA